MKSLSATLILRKHNRIDGLDILPWEEDCEFDRTRWRFWRVPLSDAGISGR